MNRKVTRTILRAASAIPGLYALLAFLLGRRVTVWGRSMAPALLPGERLLADRLAYIRDSPERGDLVLVRHPLRRDLPMLKRLAGVPGDEVGGRTLGQDEYWVVGDNSAESTDSHAFGPVGMRDLMGRVWVRYWPTGRWKVFG